VENYVRYRPAYPEAVLQLLSRDCGLNESSIVADIGSGTGISASLLLSSGATVIGIEPNKEMREAAESLLANEPRFRSVAATAEATTLASSSVDFVLAGQAFHWFDVPKARLEFLRILKPEGWCVLMWNERLDTGTRFLDGYEQILREHSPDYAHVRHRDMDADSLRSFFRHSEMQVASFENNQTFDFEGMVGRVLSSSYAPEAGQPGHEGMMSALQKLFDDTSEGGKVDFLYNTQVYYGRL
jgi:SAM-dependent methyltransferase